MARRLFGQDQAVLCQREPATAPVPGVVRGHAGVNEAGEAEYTVQLQGGKQVNTSEARLAPHLSKGEAVWYYTKAGQRLDAKVVAIDLTLWPPSYTVEEAGGTIRDTEGPRLIPADVGLYEEKRAAADAMMAELLEDERPKGAKKKRGGRKRSSKKGGAAAGGRSASEDLDDGEPGAPEAAADGNGVARTGNLQPEDEPVTYSQDAEPLAAAAMGAACAEPAPVPGTTAVGQADAKSTVELATGEGGVAMPAERHRSATQPEVAGRGAGARAEAEAVPTTPQANAPTNQRQARPPYSVTGKTLQLFVYRMAIAAALGVGLAYAAYLAFCPHLRRDQGLGGPRSAVDL
mmetsp:Transcript_3179/g.11492  ORF Transcript_3179/g.11492 Transcript_3179/m.11492 type:complete len:347 (-) Transcript_3179:2745-3785(-)|eukprot:scaffold149_cov383-Prasinococcus_capsulatus_cf.AAC.13